MVARNSEAGATSKREIVVTRVFDAPRELVFEAWTDPEQVVQWWGPHGYTTTVHEMDVRPGGVWRFVMHGPDGTDYDNRVVFIEVVKPERLVYTHGPEDQGEIKEFHVTVRSMKKTARPDSLCGWSLTRLLTATGWLSTGRSRAGSRRWSASPNTWRKPRAPSLRRERP